MGRVRLSELIAPVFAPVHQDLKRHGHAEYWLRGGRGSGKSTFAAVEVLLELLRHPSANAIVLRRVANTLRESAYAQMIWAIERLGLERYFRFRLEPMEMEYLPTGQKVLFRGADDPAKLKSIKTARGYFGVVWFEELAEFSGMDAIRTIKASVLRGGDAIVICSYNPPSSMRSWVNAEAMLGREDRMVHESCYLDLPKDWLGAAFLNEAAQLRRVNERAYRQMYLGEATGSGGQVFDNLSLRPLTQAEEGMRAWCGLDFGFAVDPDAFIRVGYDSRLKKLCVIDEFWSVRTPEDVLAEEILRRAAGDVVRCDSAEPRMISHLRRCGVAAIPVKKGPGSVSAGIRFLQSCGEIVIDPKRCPAAAREFSGYEYALGPNGTFLSELPDRDNHLIDAARYALEGARGLARTEQSTKEGGRALRGRFFFEEAPDAKKEVSSKVEEGGDEG